jgi:hypothetical protein
MIKTILTSFAVVASLQASGNDIDVLQEQLPAITNSTSNASAEFVLPIGEDLNNLSKKIAWRIDSMPVQGFDLRAEFDGWSLSMTANTKPQNAQEILFTKNPRIFELGAYSARRIILAAEYQVLPNEYGVETFKSLDIVKISAY